LPFIFLYLSISSADLTPWDAKYTREVAARDTGPEKWFQKIESKAKRVNGRMPANIERVSVNLPE
jgi:hypothetical protein